MRSKARVFHSTGTLASDLKFEKPSDLPVWNYDGSSTEQAPGSDSEVLLYPVAIYPDPFRKGPNILVMCEALAPGTDEPVKANYRSWAKSVFDQLLEEKPWYGIEQEFFLMDPKTGKPIGFPADGEPMPQFQYYCAAGADNSFGRAVINEHLDACIYAGLAISGINAEVAPGQWEYQIGPAEGIAAGDQLCMSRYILSRIAELHGYGIELHPKPVKGDWNGSGCHTNFSTESMRKEGGLSVIKKAMEALSTAHADHMALYGEGNRERMTGVHETASYDTFTFDVANRGCSVRIGRDTEKDGKGYFEDRRPASNMDPYLVTGMLMKTVCVPTAKMPVV